MKARNDNAEVVTFWAALILTAVLTAAMVSAARASDSDSDSDSGAGNCISRCVHECNDDLSFGDWDDRACGRQCRERCNATTTTSSTTSTTLDPVVCACCGDVTDDCEVMATDARMVLLRAVSLPVELSCDLDSRFVSTAP